MRCFPARVLWTFLAASFAIGSAFAQETIKVNQTEGFAGGKELVFTYTQQYYCTDEPFDDLNHNGKVAAVDANEFQRPICTIGAQPKIDPTGQPVAKTDKLWVIVPFFETDPSQPAFTPELGATLKQLVGFVPDGFKIKPGVPVQCPEPGPTETIHKGMPGTCTMHTTQIDLGPLLNALGLVPPNTNVFTPTVNHSHIIAVPNYVAEWWQVEVVLVTDPAAWPNQEGSSGITSLDKLRAAQKANQASGDIPTNFFLFFSSVPEM
ncbi:MAG TPA: hypothetical protein VKR60_15140 [Candidatus Sulfotelmatobacter sp.]|nr:hypothetical protein [Candidatus Sulfotelmatobacter sp.]